MTQSAINQGRIAPRTVPTSERSNLADVVPLRAPFVLMVDPSSACNLKCAFCPTGDRPRIKETGRYNGLMDIDVFKTILAHLEDFENPVRVLRLYKEGEPLLHKQFPDFVRLAKASKKILRIDTTTNGLPLSPSLNKQLINSKIDQINISVNGMTASTFYRITKKKVNIDAYISNIIDLCERSQDTEIYIKAIKENLPEQERDMFLETFSPYADRIFFEHLQPNWPDFEFNYDHEPYTVGHYGQPIENREVCPYIFYMMVVNADGSVSACVQDWQHDLIVGDIRSVRLSEIWNGSILKEMQKDHLDLKKNKYRNCSICPVLAHGSLDNIDQSRNLIAARIL